MEDNLCVSICTEVLQQMKVICDDKTSEKEFFVEEKGVLFCAVSPGLPLLTLLTLICDCLLTSFSEELFVSYLPIPRNSLRLWCKVVDKVLVMPYYV